MQGHLNLIEVRLTIIIKLLETNRGILATESSYLLGRRNVESTFTPPYAREY
jgi:hypothetical protein